MRHKTLGSTLAHGLARRSGREGADGLGERFRMVVGANLATPGKQTRSAVFKRWQRDVEGLYGDLIILKLGLGQKKARQVAYLLLEPEPDGTHTVFVHLLSFREGYLGSFGLIRFPRHALARLMQSAGVTQIPTLFRGLRPMFLRYLFANLAEASAEMLVLVDPVFGWMPACMTQDDVMEVRTVIPEMVLGNPHKKELFHRCIDEGRAFLIETRSVSDAKHSIGNVPSSLVPGPIVRNFETGEA